jgi:hypothetical protein
VDLEPNLHVDHENSDRNPLYRALFFDCFPLIIGVNICPTYLLEKGLVDMILNKIDLFYATCKSTSLERPINVAHFATVFHVLIGLGRVRFFRMGWVGFVGSAGP